MHTRKSWFFKSLQNCHYLSTSISAWQVFVTSSLGTWKHRHIFSKSKTHHINLSKKILWNSGQYFGLANISVIKCARMKFGKFLRFGIWRLLKCSYSLWVYALNYQARRTFWHESCFFSGKLRHLIIGRLNVFVERSIYG